MKNRISGTLLDVEARLCSFGLENAPGIYDPGMDMILSKIRGPFTLEYLEYSFRF